MRMVSIGRFAATAVLALAGIAVNANAGAISPADITSNTFVSWSQAGPMALPTTATDYVSISGITFVNSYGAQTTNNIFLVPDAGSWDFVTYLGVGAPPSLFMPPASFTVGPEFSVMPQSDYANFSGTVSGNPVDFIVAAATVGNSVSSQNPTPEPSTLGILAISLILIHQRRRSIRRAES